MSGQYVPKLRQRFLEDMQIKELQPKTQAIYLPGSLEQNGPYSKLHE